MSKVALITGASSGIGKDTAIRLKSSGYTVYGASRRAERMKDLEAHGIKTLQLDITVDESVKDCIETIIANEGRIDVLVNNAGYGSFGTLEDVPIEEARRQFEVNVFGLGRITQLVIPHMRERKSGRIVNITSIGGKITTPFGGWYQSSKHALEALSDSLRMDLKSFGIDVVIVEPGLIKSEWAEITKDNLLKVTSSHYIDKAENSAAGMMKNYERASEPSVISRVIHRAVTVRNPKTRYVAGKMAKLSLFLKSILSDRAFDTMIMKMA